MTPLTENQIFNSFMHYFNQMEAGVKCELTCLNEINKVRKEYSYLELKPFTFQRVGQTLVFDWKGNNWGESTVDLSKVDNNFAVAAAFPLAFAFTLAQLTLAFTEGKFRKIDGKDSVTQDFAMIGGKKYKLIEEE